MADWVLPILGSALFLGVYDVFKKHAVRENSVMPVLFLATLSGTVFFMVLTGVKCFFAPVSLNCSAEVLRLVFLKSLLVSASWAFVYYGLRELPVSIAAPLRATGPLWSVIGAIILFGEMPYGLQWLGMVLILSGCFLFTLVGKKENSSWRSKGFLFTMTGTLLGACSALYDKFLLGTKQIDPVSLQFHFSWLLVVILGTALLCRTLFFSKGEKQFQWRWSIAATGVLLIAADALYFYALSLPDTKISILSLLRRSSVVAAFAIGGGFFKEKHLLSKAAILVIILIGVTILTLCK